MKQNYINHIALVLDASTSMYGFSEQVIKVADAQIENLARRSKELDQETRITVYVFADTVKCIVYDKDVLRMPSLRGEYKASGNTALIDASLKAIDDLAATPELYGDHAFLLYVLTDGENNISNHRISELNKKITGLKDNWTVAVFVPNQNGKFEAKKFGFPADNISVWDVNSAKGVSEVGEVMRATTDAFMTARSAGIRGYKNLFNIDTTAISKQNVTAALAKLHPGQYRFIEVTEKIAIAPFIESHTKRAYRMGEGYYELTKPEKVQPDKAVALFDIKTKSVYIGKEARTLLNLPDHEVKVAPSSHPDYKIYIQSKSVNRNLVPGTILLLLS